MAQAPVRSLVLWFPDWPITALLRETARPKAAAVVGVSVVASAAVPAAAPAAEGVRALAPPIALVANNMIVACSPAARAEGVRRGQRRRDAQARCPQLRIVAADPARDHRVFAPAVSVVEERAPGVQIIRPGVCALRARGVARYYGGETEAAIELIQVLAAHGIEGVRAGIADGPFTAEQAREWGILNRVCEPGELWAAVMETATAIARMPGSR